VPRILVVDDDAAIRELLRFVLEEEGYEVIEAADGAEGLQRYQAAPTDLVITDLQMPGMDGLELMMALRRMVPTPVLMAISGDLDALTQAKGSLRIRLRSHYRWSKSWKLCAAWTCGTKAMTRLHREWREVSLFPLA
jgi:CheY-like chemotaxis protein